MTPVFDVVTKIEATVTYRLRAESALVAQESALAGELPDGTVVAGYIQEDWSTETLTSCEEVPV